MFTCQYCQKNFTSKSNLNIHIQKTKKCIQNRDIENDINTDKVFKCELCDKVLSSKYRLDCHKEKCKDSTVTQKINELTKQLVQKETLIEQHRKQLDEQKEIIKDLQDRLQNICEKAINKPTNITTNKSDNHYITNTYNNLQPINLSQEYLYEVLDKNLKLEHVYEGQKGLAAVVADKILKDSQGKYLAFCNDKSRQIVKYKNTDDKVIKDTKAYNLVSSIAPVSEIIANKRRKEFEKIHYPNLVEEENEDEEKESEEEEDLEDFFSKEYYIIEKSDDNLKEKVLQTISQQEDWSEDKKMYYYDKIKRGIIDLQILQINPSNFSKQLSMMLPAESLK